MICVPEAVNKLFPELDLSAFPARTVGYGIGELQMMLPKGFIIEPIYVDLFKPANQYDLQITYTENIIPLFFFTKQHCFLEYYDIENEKIGEYDEIEFFKVDKIYKICCVLDYETRRMIGFKRDF